MFSSTAYGAVPDYESTVNALKQDDQKIETKLVTDSSGRKIETIAREDTVYVKSRTAVIRETPDEKGKEVRKLLFGGNLQRTAVCENGWSKVDLILGDEIYSGYVADTSLSDQKQLEAISEMVEVAADSEILDYPAKKDGRVIGSIEKGTQVKRTGAIDQAWSRIRFQGEDGVSHVGYVPTSVLDAETEYSQEVEMVAQEETATLHASAGTGIFAEAIEGVTQVKEGDSTSVEGVQVGEPIAVSSSSTLKSLGRFRITHYCACSICCGAYSNGYTATGARATTNRTIAVNPSQIPYGSKVVINGQVYVAEDCGGAIVDNCIDIYVATHEEGLSKGTFYTDVYLIEES